MVQCHMLHLHPTASSWGNVWCVCYSLHDFLLTLWCPRDEAHCLLLLGRGEGPSPASGCLSSVSPSGSEYDGRILMLNNSTMSWTLSKMKKRIFTLCFLFIMPINVPSSVRLWSSHAKFAPCLPLVYISCQAWPLSVAREQLGSTLVM